MTRVEAAIEALYARFAAYALPTALPFCDFCWEAADVERLRASPLRSLEVRVTQALVWEASDHWPSVEVYKHFLPRLLEALTPETGIDVEDLYPAHLFEVLAAQGFRDWRETERRAVLEWVEAMQERLTEGDERDEWIAAALSLRS